MMIYTKKRTLNLRGKLYTLDQPKVMGILNVTPDSFYDGGQYHTEDTLRQRITQMLQEGADMIDVGAYSSRPGADDVSPAVETERLCGALDVIQTMGVDLPLSVDTFRSSVADVVLERYPVAMINDISGGKADDQMYDVVAKHQAAYVLMHMRGTPQTMQQHTQYDNLISDILLYFSERVKILKEKGLKDIIIDPGFGFAKDLDQNYRLLSELEVFEAIELPLLVGVSRKSMVYNLLQVSPDQALNGTTVIQTMALSKGADILRVHDVKAAKEAVAIMERIV